MPSENWQKSRNCSFHLIYFNIFNYRVSQKKVGVTTCNSSSNSHFFLGHLVVICDPPQYYFTSLTLTTIVGSNKSFTLAVLSYGYSHKIVGIIEVYCSVLD